MRPFYYSYKILSSVAILESDFEQGEHTVKESSGTVCVNVLIFLCVCNKNEYGIRDQVIPNSLGTAPDQGSQLKPQHTNGLE